MNTELNAPESAWTTRDFRPADAPVLYGMVREADSELASEAVFSAALAEAWVRVACEPDGALLGFASIVLPGRIAHLFVVPASRRQGIASALLEDLDFLAAAMGSAKIEVQAPEAARAFFAGRGFVPNGERLEKRFSA